METHPQYLFIYGTLLNADNEFGRYLKANSQYFSTGSFPGVLYDLGEYPGSLYQPETFYKVYGDVVVLNNNEVFKNLDEYEGYGDDQQQPNLFIREVIPVDTENGNMNCWVYLYNLTIEGYPQITSGRYNKNAPPI